MDAMEWTGPVPAEPWDVPAAADLAQRLRDHFPGFVREEFTEQVTARLPSGEALVIRRGTTLAGCIIFSRERREIDFLAVDPACRRAGAAIRLLAAVMDRFPAGTELSVVTYRAGDPLGIAARRLYGKFGFRPGKLVTAFDYPCQVLTGPVPERFPEEILEVLGTNPGEKHLTTQEECV